MAESTHPSPPAPPTFGEEMARLGHWARTNPRPAALLALLLGGLGYFFGGHHLFNSGTESVWLWGWRAWNEGNDLEHGRFILPVAMVVAWLHREDFRRAAKAPSWLGWPVTLLGVFLFVVSVWVQQPRIAIVSFPVLIFGGVLFLWGWPAARLAVFPCAFLLFMVPIGFVLGHTEPLQHFVATTVAGLSNFIGIGVERSGVMLLASDGSFHCEVAGGCSGVRSLMAMAMLSSLYGHFTLRATWQRVLIFCLALPFAVVGNVGRVFSIVVASKLFGESFGTGPWHDISGFIVTIPIAVGAMIGVANLLNHDWTETKAAWLKPEAPAKPAAATGAKAENNPISYDY